MYSLKCRKVLFCVLVLTLLFAQMIPAVGAKTAEEIEELHLIQTIDEPENMGFFSCFAISKSGKYALGFNGLTRYTVVVFENDGRFSYAFTVGGNGSIDLGFENENILVYRVRGNQVLTIDENGTVLNVRDMSEEEQSNLFKNTIRVNNTTYIARHWLFNHELLRWGTYPQLVMIEADGTETVLHNGSINWKSAVIATIVFCAIPAIVGVYYLIKYHKKKMSFA